MEQSGWGKTSNGWTAIVDNVFVNLEERVLVLTQSSNAEAPV